MGFGTVFSSFRIWIVCMRVWDRSKLQEWKQISRQDDFKQTVQNMRVSTMCTPSPPMILPSEKKIFETTSQIHISTDSTVSIFLGRIGLLYSNKSTRWSFSWLNRSPATSGGFSVGSTSLWRGCARCGAFGDPKEAIFAAWAFPGCFDSWEFYGFHGDSSGFHGKSWDF